MENGLYKQVVGIPQGSILSTLLCSIFYAEFEQKRLKHLQLTQDGILLRFVDDFLLITFKLSKARKFLSILLKGDEEYGCFINPEKSLCNFDAVIGGRPIPKHSSDCTLIITLYYTL